MIFSIELETYRHKRLRLIRGIKTLQHLLFESLAIYSDIRDEIKRIIDEYMYVDKEYSYFAARQLHYFSERCQAITLLIQDWKLWDCDILMRSILECATRFIFVSVAEEAERASRVKEFTVYLNEIYDIHRSDKAKLAANSPIEGYNSILLGGVVLSKEKEEELRLRWPKSKRKKLQQKWSFSEIVKELSNFDSKKLNLSAYKGFLHTYGISSHLIHADQVAMDLAYDRATREPDILKKLEQAHFARLVTDQISMLFICWRALVFATKIDSEAAAKIINDLNKLYKESDIYHEVFARTQMHLYE